MLAFRSATNSLIVLFMAVCAVQVYGLSQVVTEDLKVQCQFPNIAHVLGRDLRSILAGKLIKAEILGQLHTHGL
jgi:hypothetical protein